MKSKIIVGMELFAINRPRYVLESSIVYYDLFYPGYSYDICLEVV